MVKFVTASLGAVAVMGQVPDLREGDCVRALDNIEYEGGIPRVDKGDRGMVTGKGISWENRQWVFKYSPAEKQILFQQRNAVIHRSMVEKMSETEGYGTIEQKDDPTKCLTVFELDAIDEKVAQSPKVQWWNCEPGWADQIFIYPACGVGPGQIRWAKDPQMCLYRQVHNQKLVLSQCEWTQPFIFKLRQEPGASMFEKELRVGVFDPNRAVTAADEEKANSKHPHCFSIQSDEADGFKDDKVFAHSDPGRNPGNTACTKAIFKGLWEATELDV